MSIKQLPLRKKHKLPIETHIAAGIAAAPRGGKARAGHEEYSG
ncbi:MAG: hypothetical protein ACK5TU_12430 [Cyclobacteriaceae bacterium]